MGSYDTGECTIMPRRSTSARSYTPPSRPRASEPDIEDRVGEAIENYQAPSSSYDPELKTIVALGGGLTPDRIVQPVPEEVRDGDLTDVVKYMMGPEVATRPEDRTIVEAVQERMEKPNYRVIINSTLNFSNDKMSRPLVQYLNQKNQEGEDGEIKFNFADIAIVSHEEGGNMYKPLERLV